MEKNNRTNLEPLYDIKILKHGRLYNLYADNRLRILLMLFWIAPLMISGSSAFIGFLAGETGISSNGLQVFSFYVFVASFGVYAFYSIIWGWWLMDIRYRKSLERFVNVHALEEATEQELFNILPASLSNAAHDNKHVEGYIFHIGQSELIVADFSYTLSNKKNDHTYYNAVAIQQFNASYPHIYLDSRSNDYKPDYKKNQKIELEGDFNKYFDFYMPKGSQTGVLTILSPDVMQTLIDTGKSFDIEIEGNQVSLITSGLAFTQENLKKILVCMEAINKELGELNTSWKPIYDSNNESFTLKRKAKWVVPMIILIIYTVYIFLT